MHRNSIFKREGGIVYKEHKQIEPQKTQIGISRSRFTIYEGLDLLPNSPRFNDQQAGMTSLGEDRQDINLKAPRVGQG